VEGVRTVRLALDPEVGNHNSELGRVALGDPVLGGLVGGCVEDELLGFLVPVAGGLDDEAGEDAGLRAIEWEVVLVLV
jgi:hypothetical protein